MSAASLVFDERLTGYDFGLGHPMAPVRLELTLALAAELGVLDGLESVPFEPASVEQLTRVHTPQYVRAVQAIRSSDDVDLSVGLGNTDNPTFAHMHDAGALIAGATIEAARRVWTGEADRAVSIAGGLHHAMPGVASGFCIYNDLGAAIAWMLDHGAERVAYVDVDAHHGDGVQQMFWDDPRVLTVSVHEGPQTLFPGTGSPTEVGGPGAEGYAVNVALPPGTDDRGWLRAFDATVPEVLRAFAPQVLVTQHGCDSHAEDPLTNLMLSVDGQRASYLRLADLAEELCGGRWVATGGGGYAVLDVVPRAWSHLLAIVAGKPLDLADPTPPAWSARVAELKGRPGPSLLGEGRPLEPRPFEDGYDPASWLDRSILATRREVFPYHGLDPQP